MNFSRPYRPGAREARFHKPLRHLTLPSTTPTADDDHGVPYDCRFPLLDPCEVNKAVLHVNTY